MSTVRNYKEIIEKNETIATLFLIGFYKGDGGDYCYIDINGGDIVSAAHDYFSHQSVNQIMVDFCENKKYIGESYTLHTLDKVVHVACPKFVIDLILDGKTKDWKHTKNLFLKYMRTKKENIN